MRTRLTTAILGLALAIGWVAVLRASAPTFEEAALPPASDPYEVNASAGGVYVSDAGLGAIWQIATGGAYTRYELLTEVVDAQADSGGAVWWTDALDGFGRLAPATGTATRWTLDGEQNLGGLAFDQAGRVWLTQYYGNVVYRFDPASTEVCTYTVGVPSYYVLAGLAPGDTVWLGNWSSDRIYRLDPAREQATWWQITGDNATPVGLAMDGDGSLWWADSSQGVLARLEPALDRMTAYALPLGTTPQMVVLHNEQVWYTEEGQGTLGLLDPTRASGASATLVSGTVSLTPACRSLGAGTTASVPTKKGTLAWTSGTLEPSLDAGGFTVYELPTGSSPYGLAASEGYLWVADQGRQKLVRLAVPDVHNVYLPMVFQRASP